MSIGELLRETEAHLASSGFQIPQIPGSAIIPRLRRILEAVRAGAKERQSLPAPVPDPAAFNPASSVSAAASTAQTQFDIAYSIVRKHDAVSNPPLGLDMVGAMVCGMVLCKQDPKFSSMFAIRVCNDGVDPQTAWNETKTRFPNDYRELHLRPVQVECGKPAARPVRVEKLPGYSYTTCVCNIALRQKDIDKVTKAAKVVEHKKRRREVEGDGYASNDDDDDVSSVDVMATATLNDDDSDE